MALPDHSFALKKVTELLTGAGGMVKQISDIKVVGHRVVHGGDKFSTPAIVDATTESEIEKCVTLAPLHNPANLSGIRAARGAFPSATQIAVFDTASMGQATSMCQELRQKHWVSLWKISI